MADTEITITVAEAQMTTLKKAMSNEDDGLSESDIDAAYIKEVLVSRLKNIVASYDKQKQAVSYSTFTPS